MADDDVRYAFLVEWFDPQASLLKKYNLFFWPETNSLEMFDLKNRRTFLKRLEYPSVTLDSLFIGATLTVYGRLLKVVDFADPFTSKKLAQRLARTTCIIKPSGQDRFGSIIDALIKLGFSLARLQTVRLGGQQSKALAPQGESSIDVSDIPNGISTALELVAPNAIDSLKAFAKSHSDIARDLIVAESAAHHEKLLQSLFGTRHAPTAVTSNCSMAVIKPHAVREGLTGQIIQAILEKGFTISAGELFYLDRPAVEEFLDVYKGVIPQYSSLVENFTSGASIALQIQGGDNVVEEFREAAGPHDPEIGKHLRPQSIRARFGTDRINNGIHATDIREDGTLESEFFFKILQDAKV